VKSVPNAASPVRRARRVAGGLVVAAALLPACTGDNDDAVSTTTMAATTTTVVERVGNGTLEIGIFLPLTGPGAPFGPPMVTGIEEAVDHINAEGGVLGRNVVLKPARDEGSEAIDRVLADGVDAIVGPASSLTALGGLAPAADDSTGVVTCSPMATARSLDDYPNNFFFRTAPSDTLQMAAIARLAERTGAQEVAVGYLDDPYGRGLAEALEEALRDRPLSVGSSVGFSGDTGDLAPVARELLADDPRVVVVLGDADDGSRLLAALDEETTDPPVVLVNDSIRQARQIIQDLSGPFREQLTGVAPQPGPASEDHDDHGFFVAHAIDCVNLIALAAIDAGTDNPVKFRARMSAVSTGGRVCTTFEECTDLLVRGLGIDYNGQSGPLDLSATGDPTRALFESFTFNEEGGEVHDEPPIPIGS
jgi:branched-chain amino acid transport system substrate-binding protein